MPTFLPPPAELPFVTDTITIDAAERVIVYSYVEWSGPERQGRPIILEAVSKLRASDKIVAFDFFAIEEDDPTFVNWFMSLNLPEMQLGGWGSVFWLEHKKCIGFVNGAVVAGVEKLISLTNSHWEMGST